jgi:hypothetical protein
MYFCKIVLCGCNTWLLTLREERRLRVFENRMLRRIFGPKRDMVTGEWRKLHNEQLNDLHSSLDIVLVIKSRRMRWAGHVARMGKRRDVYRVLVGKPEGNKVLKIVHSFSMSYPLAFLRCHTNTADFFWSRLQAYDRHTLVARHPVKWTCAVTSSLDRESESVREKHFYLRCSLSKDNLLIT